MNDRRVIAVVDATGSQGHGLVHVILGEKNSGFKGRALTRDLNSDKGKDLARMKAAVVAADVVPTTRFDGRRRADHAIVSLMRPSS